MTDFSRFFNRVVFVITIDDQSCRDSIILDSLLNRDTISQIRQTKETQMGNLYRAISATFWPVAQYLRLGGSESFSLRDSVSACIDIGSPKAGRLIRSRYSLAPRFRIPTWSFSRRKSFLNREILQNERLSRPRKYPIKNVLAE